MKTATTMALLLLAAAADAQQERLSLDWIFSDGAKSVTSLPERSWLNDGQVLIYDSRVAAEERTLQTLNPENGRRRSVVDAGEVLEKLAGHFEPEEPYEELGWPDAIDANGHFVAYLKSGDIVMVELGTSDVQFITATDAEETAPRFSPDGSWLAFVRQNDLYAWNVERQEEVRLTSDGSDVILNGTVSWVYWEELLGRADRGYLWSPDSASIAYLQSDESQVGLMHYVDFEPQLPELIRQRHPKPGTANPRVRAGVVGVKSKQTRWVDLGVYPYEYLVRVKWLPDSRRVAVQTLDRAQQKLDLFVADAETGEASHVLREESDSWINVHDDLHFLPNNQFVWVSEESGFAHAYLYDLNGRQLRQITTGEWSLRPSGGPPGMRQSISHIDPDSGWMYFTAQEKSSIERHLYRVRLDGSGFSRLTAPDGTHSILFQPQGEYYLDAWSAIDITPSLAIHRPDGDLARTVADAPALAERFDIQPWELFNIGLDDGFKMPAMMLRPRDFDASRKYPVVMFVYGGPAAPTVRNAWNGGSRGYYHQLLADSGFIVVYADNRSAAAIGQAFTSGILFDAWGELELQELLAAVRWLKSRPFVDSDRVGIWGWSGGGTHTLQAMTRSQEFYAGVSVAPVTDWDYYDSIYAERFMKRPEDNPEGYARTSHVEHAAQLHGRLMLIHGTYDDNVHPQNTWAFANELIEEGIMFEMMIYPMRKHGISDDAAQRHIYETMLEFWKRSLH
jgi:dipeptidyl-peptidase-4